jgi:hypothetical protein
MPANTVLRRQRPARPAHEVELLIETHRSAAIARRTAHPLAPGHVLAAVLAHADAVERGRPTVSPLKRRSDR